MKILIDKIELHYDQEGKGPDVVLLHGWGGSRKSFSPVFTFLREKYRITSFDLPGFGESAPPPGAWSSREYAELLAKVFGKLGIKEPVLIGHSFGGKVSLRLAKMIPIRKMILANPSGIKPKRPLSYYLRVYSFKLGKRLLSVPGLAKYKEQLIRHFASGDYSAAKGVMRQTLVRTVNEDLSPSLPGIKVPTLLVWGALDKDTPPYMAKKMEKLIPNAGLIMFQDAGHFSYLDKLTDFIIITNEFLKDLV